MSQPTTYEKYPSPILAADAVCNYMKQPNRPNEICVVTNKPEELKEITERKWQHEIQRVSADKDGRINIVDEMRLDNQLTLMQSITFAIAPPADLLQADVLFMSPSEHRHYRLHRGVIAISVEEEASNPEK